MGLKEEERQALKAGLEANMFEFRLANHSAILFNGEVPVALTGDLLRAQERVTLANYREKPRGAVHGGRAVQRTEPHLPVPRHAPAGQGEGRDARRVPLDRARRCARSRAWTTRSAAWSLVGFLGTAAILAFAVHRAIRPVEEVTRLAEEAEATDLSRRVRVSSGGEEFRRLAAVINSLFDRLERAFRAQRRLVADAAHELKTPTAVLVGEAQDALRPEATEEERRRSLQTIADASKGLAREVDGLLLLARGDAASPRRTEELDLSDDRGGGARRRRGPRRAPQRRLRLHAQRRRRACAASGRGCCAWFRTSSPTRSSTSNAGAMVELSIAGTDDTVVLEVADHGPGIAQGDRERIFERFVRLEKTRERNPQGSGLGLAIVEQVAAAHGGSVEVRENEGGGAVFRVTLPATRT